MQRTVESTRRSLLAARPRLPVRGVVRYSNLPRVTDMGFAGPRALQTWYADTSLSWTSFGGLGGLREETTALVEFERHSPWPAVLIDARSLELFRRGFSAASRREDRAAESLLVAARGLQLPRAPGFEGVIDNDLGWIALGRHELARADALADSARMLGGETAGTWALTAYVAAARGDMAAAREAVSRSLALDATDVRSLRLLRALAGGREAPH
jgi:hypothetical protein